MEIKIVKLLKPTLIAASVMAATAAFAAGQSATTGASVTTYPSPLLGWSTAFDGSDTLGYAHSYDLNLSLLKNHSKATQRANSNRPRIQVGGEVAADLKYYQGGTSSAVSSKYTESFALSTAKLDFAVDASKMVSGYISLGMDKKGTSTFSVQQAFFTYGNLNVNPFFVTAGAFYVPFGRYADYMVTDTATETLGQTKANAIDLGVTKKGWTVEAYGFQSAYKNKSTDTNPLIDGGVNVQFDKNFSKGELTLGAGYLSNMANTDSFVAAAGTTPKATGTRVGAVNAHARFQNSKMDLIAGYVKAMKKFGSAANAGSLSGKEPTAMDLQAVYKAHFHSKPWYLGAGFENTSDAGHYTTDTGPMPKSQFSAMVDTNLFKNTALMFQYSHQKMYSGVKKDSANVIEAEFDLYF